MLKTDLIFNFFKTMNFNTLHTEFKEPTISGRYITLKEIEPLLSQYKTRIVSKSVLNKPIYKYIVGKGKTKVFMWSQMHGNEGTTTKALFDFFNLIHSQNEIGVKLLSEFTFCFLPMVNPDGAKLYTRENANLIDLNRDAKNQSQPESIVLRQVFEDFKPDYCYNLHDQRTIYGTNLSGKPATVSFLAPSFNENRDVNSVRTRAMNIIAAMNTELQKYIPGQVGRYEDEFNDNCIGETFQINNVPTILFESGHYQNDYEREITRKMIFIALVSGLLYIYENDVVVKDINNYLEIPQNNVCFYDFIFKNVKINYDNNKIITNFGVQYVEKLINSKILFEAQIAQIGILENYFGHFEYDAKNKMYSDFKNNMPELEQKADFDLEDIKIRNGIIQN
jgi:Zinc carboxypeptidase